MRPIRVLLLLLFAASLSAAPRRAITPAPSLPVAALDAVGIQYAHANPGLAIAVKKGNAYFVRGYGFVDTSPAVATAADAIFEIGSVTKQFTAAAIMRLAEAGKLSIDDPARKYLPELDARFDAVTIRHLLTHTSGVRDYNAQLSTPYEPKTQQEIFQLITNGPPYFAPGTQYLYSNSGYFLLGMIIERITSRTFEQYVRETFLAPLGLTRTSYCGTFAPSPDGYYIQPDGSMLELKSADMSLVFAAGALCSSALDLVRWNAALASGAAVSRDSYARMTTETVAVAPGIRYGFGLLVDRFENRRRIWHNGAILGFMTHLSWYPDEDLSIAVLVNVIDLEHDRPTDIANEIARVMKP